MIVKRILIAAFVIFLPVDYLCAQSDPTVEWPDYKTAVNDIQDVDWYDNETDTLEVYGVLKIFNPSTDDPVTVTVRRKWDGEDWEESEYTIQKTPVSWAENGQYMFVGLNLQTETIAGTDSCRTHLVQVVYGGTVLEEREYKFNI